MIQSRKFYLLKRDIDIMSYGDAKYWDERYTLQGPMESFDWLESYYTLKDILQNYMISKKIKILVVGCGNAEFSADLYDNGYKNITNVDFSKVVIR